MFGQNMKVFLWSDFVDLRKGFDGLSALVQEALKEAPFSVSVLYSRTAVAIASNC